MDTCWYFVIAWLILGFPALWVVFLAVMNLQQAKDAGRLQQPAYTAGKLLLVIGLILDFAVQISLATILWVDFPREGTVSARVARLCADSGWRGNLARWFRDRLLSPFDTSGGHG